MYISLTPYLPGHYKTDVIDTQSNTYKVDPNLNMLITVYETFDNDHRVVSQRTAHSGQFTFTAADPGQHKLCLTPDSDAATGGWLSGSHAGGVRVSLDVAIGETSRIESEDKGKLENIVQKVRDLNGRLQDIRREQVFQRVCSFVFCLLPLDLAWSASTMLVLYLLVFV